MAELEVPYRFIQSLFYPSRTTYHAEPPNAPNGKPPVEATSSDAFLNSRKRLLEQLIAGQPRNREFSQAIALEHMVDLTLRNPLDDTGFTLELTPQSLERSIGSQKGVDLLVRDNQNLVYLGIDLKTGKGSSRYERDGYGWNSTTQSPYIYLSLGSFAVNTREQSAVAVREWLNLYAIPSILNTGKIPLLGDFRTYLISRIERSLHGCLEVLREPEEDRPPFGLPQSDQELTIMGEKLSIMHSLFYDLRIAG